jgi:predicted secreted protein
MAITLGNNMVLYNTSVNPGTVYGASTTCSFSTSSSLIEVTTAATGNFKEFLPSNTDFEITCDGFVTRDNYDYKDLLDAQIARSKLNVKFQIVNVDGTVTVNADVYVSSLSLNAPAEGAGTYSVTLKGTGAFTFV